MKVFPRTSRARPLQPSPTRHPRRTDPPRVLGTYARASPSLYAPSDWPSLSGGASPAAPPFARVAAVACFCRCSATEFLLGPPPVITPAAGAERTSGECNYVIACYAQQREYLLLLFTWRTIAFSSSFSFAKNYFYHLEVYIDF